MTEPKWYAELTPYQWRVFLCACLGWALDIMDGYLYAIILFPAMSDLLGTDRERGDRPLWRHRAEHIHDRLGSRRSHFRSHRRSLRPRQNDGDHHTDLCFVYRSLRHRDELAGTGGLSFLDRNRHRRRVGCRRRIDRRNAGLRNRAPKPPASCKLRAVSVSFSRRIVPLHWSLRVALGFRSRRAAGASSRFTSVTSLEEPQRWMQAKAKQNPLPFLFKKPVRRDVMIGTGLAVVATFGYQGAIQWVPSWIAAMLHAQGTREVIRK